MSNATEELKIRGEFTPDPNVCRFSLNRPLLEDYTLTFQSAAEGKASPLVDAVFAVEGITRLQISNSTLTLTKDSPDAWPKLARELIPRIKVAMGEPSPPISMQVLQDLKDLPAGGDIAETVERLLEESINPALASHGGWVKLVKVEDRDVHLEMGGGCQGCSASRQTMQLGIERMIREALPQVREVVDVTDHQAGDNPYYS